MPEAAEIVRGELAAVGAQFKAAGEFPLPRVCIGKGHRSIGIVDPEDFISNLRRKLETEASRPRYIITETGVGYRFRSPS